MSTAVGDFAMLGSEIVQLEAMPRGPDDDARFASFGGQRLAMLDTTAEAHANDSPVYKVRIYPPGTAQNAYTHAALQRDRAPCWR